MQSNNDFIMAEIGINHNGEIEIAKKLIDVAKNTGCDAVKFQKRTIDLVYSKELLDSPRASPWGTTQRQQKEGLEFGKKEYDLFLLATDHDEYRSIDFQRLNIPVVDTRNLVPSNNGPVYRA